MARQNKIRDRCTRINPLKFYKITVTQFEYQAKIKTA